VTLGLTMRVEIHCTNGKLFVSKEDAPAGYASGYSLRAKDNELEAYEYIHMPICTMRKTPYINIPRPIPFVVTQEHRGWTPRRNTRKITSRDITLVDAPFRQSGDIQNRRLVVTFKAKHGDCEDVINFDYSDMPMYSNSPIVAGGGWWGPRWPASVKPSWFHDAQRLQRLTKVNVWHRFGTPGNRHHEELLVKVEFHARRPEDAYAYLKDGRSIEMNDIIEVVLVTKNLMTGCCSEFVSVHGEPRCPPHRLWQHCLIRRVGVHAVSPEASPHMINLQSELQEKAVGKALSTNTKQIELQERVVGKRLSTNTK
jgi:hypothetical protein